jgi:glucose-6-phosphate 1-epimerase
MTNAQSLTLPASVQLIDRDGTLPCLEVSSPCATARVFLHGAHVAHWQPAHADAPVLWMSSHSFFHADKPIRGGVPICFPWFGPHPRNAAAPAHGFARLAGWTLVEANESGDGTVALAFSLNDSSSADWPYGFRIIHRISIGAHLTMELEVRNMGDEAFGFEEALHTYFAVEEIGQVSITGLEETAYLDKVAGFARRTQGTDPIRFIGETDRVYLDTSAACVVHDTVRQRRITIGKSGSRSTVVWNPWIEKARAMQDFGDLEWRRMVCVETANVGEAAVQLRPGGSHSMSATIGVEPVEPM